MENIDVRLENIEKRIQFLEEKESPKTSYEDLKKYIMETVITGAFPGNQEVQRGNYGESLL